MNKYDYLIVGAGLFGCVFAHEAKKANKTDRTKKPPANNINMTMSV